MEVTTTSDDLTVLATTYPELPEPQVPRDNLIGLLRDRFGPDRKIIVVQGPLGSGKTTLLAQFAKMHPSVSLSFFAGTTLLTSDPRYFLLDMCEQMGRLLRRRTQGIDQLSTDELKQLFLDFYRGVVQIARRRKLIHYFIVDGFEWIDVGHREHSIIGLLPIEPSAHIRLLLSSDPIWRPRFSHDRWDIPFFSPRETESYLADTELDLDAIRRIHQKCQGMPGYLAAVRRLLTSGSDLQTLLESLPDELKGLFQVEWNRAEVENETTLRALGILAFAKELLNIPTLAEILGADGVELMRSLGGLSFLRASAANGPVSFISDAYKQFVGEVLKNRREASEESLLLYYSRDPYARSSLVLLPTYLAKPSNYQKLRDLVNSQYLLRSLDVSRDTLLLRHTLRLASEQAFHGDDWASLQRFTLAGSILRTISTKAAQDDEVEALLALGDYGQALETAYQAILPEDKLELLARVANRMHRAATSVPQQLLVDLDQIADTINADALGDRAVDIAASLFDLMPERALRLVERSAGGEIGPRSLDMARASLAIRLHRDPKALVGSSITDHALRDFARAYSPRIAKLTAAEVLAEVESVSSTSAKLFMITSWCNEHRKDSTATVIVERALEIITNDPTYGVSMRLLWELAEPLKSGPEEVVRKLLDRIDLLKRTSLRRPVEDALRLETLLASLQARYSKQYAVDRLLELYLELDTISDLDARCYGNVRILIALAALDPEDELRLRNELETKLTSDYDTMLADSADHFAISRRILRALTTYKPEMAVTLASKLNTQSRRDEAFDEILSARIQADVQIDPAWVTSVLRQIVDEERRDVAHVSVIRQLAARGLLESRPDFWSFLDEVEHIMDPQDRCIANAYAIASLASEESSNFKKHLSNRLMSSLEQVDERWNLVGLSFWLSNIVAKTAPQLALSLFTRAKQETSVTALANRSFARTYLDCLLLVTRAITGVVSVSSNLDLHLQRIKTAIAMVPSHGHQARLLSDLALRLRLSGRAAAFASLVKDEVIPRLESCRNAYARTETLTVICPCLYEYDQSWTLEQLRHLGTPYRDRALESLTKYLLSGRVPADEITLRDLRVNLEAPQARRLTDVIDEIDTDVHCFAIMDSLVQVLVQKDPNHPDRLICRSLVERDALDIARRLKQIATTKFPDPKNIRHEGYAVAARASIRRLEVAASWRARIEPDWEDIAEAARSISNSADRAYVLTLIAERIPPENADIARGLLREAEDLVHDVPNPLDRADRLHTIARAWREIENIEAVRLVIRKAMELTKDLEWGEARDDLTGEVLELAHDIDPDLAASLVPLIDNPIIGHRHRLGLSAQALEKDPGRINLDRMSGDMQSEDLQRALADAAERIVRSTNSGTGQIRHPREVGAWLLKMQEADFESYYPVGLWAVQNILTHSRQPEVLTSMFENLYDLASLTHEVGQRLLGIRSLSLPVISQALPETVRLFKAGTRTQALVTLKEWLRDTTRHYVKIYDAYFRPSDLELIDGIGQDRRIFIVTSWKGLELPAGDRNVEQLFRGAWKSLSDQPPPWVQIHVAGTRSGDSPIHNRYVITEGAALALGTSVGGLGQRDSDIRVLSSEEAARVEAEFVDPLLSPQWLLFRGEPLIIHVFML